MRIATKSSKIVWFVYSWRFQNCQNMQFSKHPNFLNLGIPPMYCTLKKQPLEFSKLFHKRTKGIKPYYQFSDVLVTLIKTYRFFREIAYPFIQNKDQWLRNLKVWRFFWQNAMNFMIILCVLSIIQNISIGIWSQLTHICRKMFFFFL